MQDKKKHQYKLILMLFGVNTKQDFGFQTRTENLKIYN